MPRAKLLYQTRKATDAPEFGEAICPHGMAATVPWVVAQADRREFPDIEVTLHVYVAWDCDEELNLHDPRVGVECWIQKGK